MVTARVARKVGVRITGLLGLHPGWETWGPYSGLIVDWCKRLGVEVVKAFVAFNLSDQQLKWHKDRGDVNVGRVVVNLGGGGLVNLRCGNETLHYRLPQGWAYFIGPVASGKAPVSDGLFCRHSVGIQPHFRQPRSGMVATCSLVLDVNTTTWTVSAPPEPSLLSAPLLLSSCILHPLILHDWVILRDSLQSCQFARATAEAWKEKAGREEANLLPTQRDIQLQAGVVAAGRAGGRATAEAWKEKADREEANMLPTQRDIQLQAGVVARARGLREALKRKIENPSGLLGYEDTMRSHCDF
ncbi:hypothetical protein V8C86DRAFT_2748590 [Haematococcus lacustris]